LFWYDVCDFNDAETQGYDKNTRLEHAWAIFNNYLNKTAKFNLGLSDEMSENVKNLLLKCNKMSASSVDYESDFFESTTEKIAPFLKDLWINFLKDDIYKFTKYSKIIIV
jgi:hypothetical protein